VIAGVYAADVWMELNIKQSTRAIEAAAFFFTYIIPYPVYFIPLMSIPLVKCFWANRNTIAVGIKLRNTPASTTG